MPSQAAKVITDHLIESHRAYGWRAEREALFTPRRIDVLAISKGGLDVIAYEVKISRVDFRNELRDPDKRLRVMRHCTQFYFVVPDGLLHPSEIPEDCGLVYFDGKWMRVVKDSSGKNGELTFETALRIERECQEQAERDAECMLDFYRGDSSSAVDSLPNWMLPRYIKPLLFQFDVRAVAAKMASAVVPGMDLSFEQVPF